MLMTGASAAAVAVASSSTVPRSGEGPQAARSASDARATASRAGVSFGRVDGMLNSDVYVERKTNLMRIVRIIKVPIFTGYGAVGDMREFFHGNEFQGHPDHAAAPGEEIGRASCRERVCQYV